MFTLNGKFSNEIRNNDTQVSPEITLRSNPENDSVIDNLLRRVMGVQSSRKGSLLFDLIRVDRLLTFNKTNVKRVFRNTGPHQRSVYKHLDSVSE